MAKSDHPAGEPKKRGRGRPPGAKNKKLSGTAKLQAMRVEKARIQKKRPKLPAIQETIRYDDAEEVRPGEGFGQGYGAQFNGSVDVEHSDVNGQWSMAFPRRLGRKPHLTLDAFTLRTISDAGSRNCSIEQTAAALGCCDDTLRKFFVAHPVAQMVWEDGHLLGDCSLQAELHAQALNGNTTVLLHLSKYRLGHNDKGDDKGTGLVAREKIDAAADELQRRVLDIFARKRGEGVPSE